MCLYSHTIFISNLAELVIDLRSTLLLPAVTPDIDDHTRIRTPLILLGVVHLKKKTMTWST